MHLSLDLIACHMTKRNYNQHPSSRGHPHMSRRDSLDIYVGRAMETVPRTNHVSWNTAHWGHPLSAMLEFARHLCRTGHWNRHQDKPCALCWHTAHWGHTISATFGIRGTFLWAEPWKPSTKQTMCIKFKCCSLMPPPYPPSLGFARHLCGSNDESRQQRHVY
jgi:hypothetical protein